MHKDRRNRVIKGRGTVGKTAVIGLLERHGFDGHSTVRASVVEGRKRYNLSPEVRKHVAPGAADALKSYDDLEDAYVHAVIDHAERYVIDAVHTNGIENFWSLFKRALKGTT